MEARLVAIKEKVKKMRAQATVLEVYRTSLFHQGSLLSTRPTDAKLTFEQEREHLHTRSTQAKTSLRYHRAMYARFIDVLKSPKD